MVKVESWPVRWENIDSLDTGFGSKDSRHVTPSAVKILQNSNLIPWNIVPGAVLKSYPQDLSYQSNPWDISRVKSMNQVLTIDQHKHMIQSPS